MENYVEKICPFCKTEIKDGDPVKECPSCGIPHHEGCWQKNGGCAKCDCAEQHCKEQGPNPTAVCAKCGSVLSDGQEFCTKCGTPKSDLKKKTCSKCGAETQEGQEFCSKCGQKINLVTPTASGSTIEQHNQSIERNPTKFSTLLFTLGAVVIIIALLVALKNDPSVDNITLSKSELTLTVDHSETVQYTINPANASDVEIEWTSSDHSVATVNSDGEIYAKGAGACTITASAGDKSASVRVEVKDLTAQEKNLLGVWYAKGKIENDKYVQLNFDYGILNVYDDFTGRITAGGITHDFTWEFKSYEEDGEKVAYVYTISYTNGGGTDCMVADLLGEKSAVLMCNGVMLIYGK